MDPYKDTDYPAFCDTHMHLVEYGKFLSLVDLRDAKSISEIQHRLRGIHAPVVQAFGWNQENLDEGRYPNARDLDEIWADRPVVLSRICGHITLVNSYVLEDLGIRRGHIPQVEGGEIDLDTLGNPTGIFRERARDLLKDKGYYNGTLAMVRENILTAQADLLAKGIVEVHSDDLTCYPNLSGEEIMDTLVAMAREGALKLKVVAQAQGRPDLLARKRGEIRAVLGPNPRFEVGSLKLFLDGSLGARTAHLLAPYSDLPTTQGIALYEDQALLNLGRQALDVDLPLTIHAIGDGAIHRCLNLFEALQEMGASSDYLARSGIVHCQIVNQDLMVRMARLGLRAYIQPIFLHEDAGMVYSRIGQERGDRAYAFKTMHAMGIPLYMGSDAPIETPDVIKGMHCAITRQTLHQDRPPLCYIKEEALSLEVTLEAYTRTTGAPQRITLKAPLAECIEKPHINWVTGVSGA